MSAEQCEFCDEPLADHPRAVPCAVSRCDVCGDTILDDRMRCELCRYVNPALNAEL